MVTSKELKQRLVTFLEDPAQEQEFRTWFALVLRDVHASNDPTVEALAHEIMWAFYDQKRGLSSVAELTEQLRRLATESGVHFGPEPFSVMATTSTDLRAAPAYVFEASRVGVGLASVSS